MPDASLASNIQEPSRHSTVHLWDLNLERQPPLQTTLKCDGWQTAQFTPDSKTLLLTSYKGYQLYDTGSGKRLGILAESVGGASYSPGPRGLFSADSKKLAVWEPRGIRIWDLTTHRPCGAHWKLSSEAYRDRSSLTFRPDGKILFCRWSRNLLETNLDAWDGVAPRSLPLPWLADKEGFEKVLSADGAYLAVWDSKLDKAAEVVVYETTNGQTVGEPLPHSKAVQRVAFSPDNRRVLTVTSDRIVRFWSTRTGAAEGDPIQLSNNKSTNEPIFGPRGQTILAFHDFRGRIWDVATGRPLAVPDVTSTNGFRLSPDERTLLVHTYEHISDYRLWDAQTLRPAALDPAFRVLALSPDGRLAVMSRHGEKDRGSPVLLMRTDDFKPVGAPLPHSDGCSQAMFSPDGKVLLTHAVGDVARLWDTATGQPRGEPIKDVSGHAVFTPDSQTVWLVGGNRIEVRATATGQPVCQAIQHDRRVQSLVSSPDNRAVLSWGIGWVFLWDTAGRSLWKEQRGQDRPTFHVFSPDGKLLALGSREVRLLDSRTGRPVGEALRHENRLRKIAFSPDSTHLLTETVPIGGKRGHV